jgi:hypothetical protein
VSAPKSLPPRLAWGRSGWGRARLRAKTLLFAPTLTLPTYCVRGREIAAVIFCLLLSSCAQSAGEASKGFIDASLSAAFLPLTGKDGLFLDAAGAATVVEPGIAATNAHNANMVEEGSMIGQSRDYDLLFFRTDRATPPPTSQPSIGEKIIAYGEGRDGDVREARGIVRALNSPVLARCPACPVQQVFTYEANAGGGFSGGPVADAATGRLVGITFGYNDLPGGSRLMYAYDMARVFAELGKAGKKAAPMSARTH